MRKNILLTILFLSFCVSTLCALTLYELNRFAPVQVAFLDVGQGDAILITEGSYQILIDGGPDGRVLLEEIGRYMPLWDRTVELVIATHPDSDHIDGLVDLVQNYNVEQFWGIDLRRQTNVFAALERNLRNREVLVQYPERGWHVLLPSGAKLEIIYPFVAGDVVGFADEPNNASIAAIFTTADEKFFLGGDLHSAVEDLLPIDRSVTVLKSSHHGSGTSTSQYFLNRTMPRDVIISAGKDNRYNHPKDEVLDRIRRSVKNVYRTDHQGSIVYRCLDFCTVSHD